MSGWWKCLVTDLCGFYPYRSKHPTKMPFTYDFPSGKARMKNTIQIDVEETYHQQKGLIFVVREILFDVFHVKKESIMCIQDQVRRGIYIITFTSLAVCCDIYAALVKEELQEDSRLDGLRFRLLYEQEDVHLIVHIYNPHISTEDVVTFLERYCTVVRFSHLVENELGYWNAKRKFFVRFKHDPQGIGGFAHPPSNFILGKSRGYLFYSGMPLFCRNCRKFGHTQDACPEEKMFRCNKCGEPGHNAANCKLQKVCNLCGKEGHIYRACPSKSKETYADKAKKIPASSRSEPRQATSVANLAKKISGKDTPGQKAYPDSVASQKTPDHEKAKSQRARSSEMELGVRRKSITTSERGPLTSKVVQNKKTSEQGFAAPLAVSSRTPVKGLEQGPEALTAESPVRKIPGVQDVNRRKELEREQEGRLASGSVMISPEEENREKWQVKVRRSRKRRQTQKTGKQQSESPETTLVGISSEISASGESGEGTEGEEAGVLSSKENETVKGKYPAEKRLRSEGGESATKTPCGSNSSEEEIRERAEMQYMLASDPVNIDEFVSPGQGDMESSGSSSRKGSCGEMDDTPSTNPE